MAEEVTQLSIAELKQELRRQESRIGTLERRREKLEAQLREIDEEIMELTGSGASTGSRYSNSKSLHETILEVLSKNKKGLKLGELAEAVTQTGYLSSSANFKNVVYQNVYKSEDITKDEKTGRYMLSK